MCLACLSFAIVQERECISAEQLLQLAAVQLSSPALSSGSLNSNSLSSGDALDGCSLSSGNALNGSSLSGGSFGSSLTSSSLSSGYALYGSSLISGSLSSDTLHSLGVLSSANARGSTLGICSTGDSREESSLGGDVRSSANTLQQTDCIQPSPYPPPLQPPTRAEAEQYAPSPSGSPPPVGPMIAMGPAAAGAPPQAAATVAERAAAHAEAAEGDAAFEESLSEAESLPPPEDPPAAEKELEAVLVASGGGLQLPTPPPPPRAEASSSGALSLDRMALGPLTNRAGERTSSSTSAAAKPTVNAQTITEPADPTNPTSELSRVSTFQPSDGSSKRSATFAPGTPTAAAETKRREAEKAAAEKAAAEKAAAVELTKQAAANAAAKALPSEANVGPTKRAATFAPGTPTAAAEAKRREVEPQPSGSAADATARQASTASMLDNMLSLASLEVDRVRGDGNCCYYAVAGGMDGDALHSRQLWELQHRGSTSPPGDLRLQSKLRELCVNWLQRPENAWHRAIGTSSELVQANKDNPNRYTGPPPPAASMMDPHRQDSTYANMAILKAMCEVLDVTIISIDGRTLYDRVPVFNPGQPTKACHVRSWRTQLAPLLKKRASSSMHRFQTGTEFLSKNVVVIVNNGLVGKGSHFNATRQIDKAHPAQSAPSLLPTHGAASSLLHTAQARCAGLPIAMEPPSMEQTAASQARAPPLGHSSSSLPDSIAEDLEAVAVFEVAKRTKSARIEGRWAVAGFEDWVVCYKSRGARGGSGGDFFVIPPGVECTGSSGTSDRIVRSLTSLIELLLIRAEARVQGTLPFEPPQLGELLQVEVCDEHVAVPCQPEWRTGHVRRVLPDCRFKVCVHKPSANGEGDEPDELFMEWYTRKEEGVEWRRLAALEDGSRPMIVQPKCKKRNAPLLLQRGYKPSAGADEEVCPPPQAH